MDSKVQAVIDWIKKMAAKNPDPKVSLLDTNWSKEVWEDGWKDKSCES